MIIHDVPQRSDEWYALRLGIPTGSAFSKLITSQGKPSKSLPEYAATLAGEKFSGKELEAWEGNQWTERGKELEVDAKEFYEFTNDVQVKEVGFITTDDKTAGCSPDGLVNDDGMTEYKCLKAERHIKAIMYYKKHNRAQPDYIAQTQGQMHIAEREWCDLVFHHPELPTLVIRQTLDVEFCKTLNELIVEVSSERDKIVGVLNAL